MEKTVVDATREEGQPLVPFLDIFPTIRTASRQLVTHKK